MFRHHKHFGTKFRCSNFLCYNCTQVFAEMKFLKKINIDVSSLLMSLLRAIVICQKYFGNHVISSQIHLFAPLLNMRRCTLWVYSCVPQVKAWLWVSIKSFDRKESKTHLRRCSKFSACRVSKFILNTSYDCRMIVYDIIQQT